MVLRVFTYGDPPSPHRKVWPFLTPRNSIYLYQPLGSELNGNRAAPRTAMPTRSLRQASPQPGTLMKRERPNPSQGALGKKASKGISFFIFYFSGEERACLGLHKVGEEEVKGLWDETLKEKVGDASEKGLAPWGVLEHSAARSILERRQSRRVYSRALCQLHG